MKNSIHPAVIAPVIQCAIALIGVVIGLLMDSLWMAMSFLIGAFSAAIPQGVFGWWVYRARGARQARAIAHNLFIGEGLKLSLSAILLASVWGHTDGFLAEAVLAGFVVATLAGQLSLPLLINGRPLR